MAEAGDAEDLMRKVAAHKPDVAIVDVQMPPDNTDDGLRAALAIRERQPDVGVLVLSQFVEHRYAVDLIGSSAGASATCSRTACPTSPRSPTPCGASARRIGVGPGRGRGDAGSPPARRPAGAPHAAGARGAGLMAEGRSNRGIADVMVVTPHAVEKHVTSIFVKLGIAAAPADHRRVRAVLAFLGA